MQRLQTGGHEVHAACLVDGGQYGVSMVPHAGAAGDAQTLILGCNDGHVLKFEKSAEGAKWTQTGHMKVGLRAYDVLQT